MCKEQKHSKAILAGHPCFHKGEDVKSFVGMRNWSVSHDGIVEFQRALSKGMSSDDPSEFVFDILFSLVTLRYQGFAVSVSKHEVEFYCANLQLKIQPKLRKAIGSATRTLVEWAESSFDMSGNFTAWYTHRVAAYEPMPFIGQLWRDFVLLCEGIWPEISDYEVNHNGGDPLFDSATDGLDVVYQFLDEHEFDVFGNMAVES